MGRAWPCRLTTSRGVRGSRDNEGLMMGVWGGGGRGCRGSPPEGYDGGGAWGGGDRGRELLAVVYLGWPLVWWRGVVLVEERLPDMSHSRVATLLMIS